MAMNPRAGQNRPGARRDRLGPRPPVATADPRRRPAGAKARLGLATLPTPTSLPDPSSATLDALLDDLTQGWERGERPGAERYLGLLPAEDSAELIYQEYCLAEEADLDPDPAEYLRRFPDHADRLSRLFALHDAFPSEVFRDWGAPADLPSSGDEIGPYHLLRELGRGAFARVFLAEQADLEHRLVVLKVSARATAEPGLLSRARHTHIVEVLRHATTEEGLHLVCMPFLGGATLASVLDVRRASGRRVRSGADFLADLDRVSAPEYPRSELVRPAREILGRLTYPQGMAWVVARLAEALDHAYVRGVAHGDLKPANVLIAADGAPLLLDMNLSTDWLGSDLAALGPADGPPVDLGGTLAYMAPERLSAIAGAGLEAPPEVKPLDRHRADLYALGLVLLEALTGRAPEVPPVRGGDARATAALLTSTRQTLPPALLGRPGRALPPALRSILAKCLVPDPRDRYARGNELAADLDRWRSDRPLAFAEEPHRTILARLSRRGRFFLIASGLVVAGSVVVACFASTLLTGSKRDDARDKESMIRDRPDSGAFTFRWPGRWRDEDPTDPAELTARQLARYGVLDDPDWRDRDDVRLLPDRERGDLEAWLLEQVLRHAVALRQRPDSPGSWRRALVLLDQTLARTWSAPLHLERRILLGQLGLPESLGPADVPRVPRWMDEYLAGVAAEPLHAREALDHYLESLKDRPEDLFWARYRAAHVANRIGEYDVAAEQIRRCVDRSPENPALRLMLASTLTYAEQNAPRPAGARPFADALVECDKAVRLAPDFAIAYEVRAWVRQAAGWTDGVQNDLDRHAELTRRGGPAPALILALSFTRDRQAGPDYAKPPEAARSLARKILDESPRDPKGRMALGSMYASEHRSADAVAEFDRVLDANAEHLRARYQKAGQLFRLDPDAAIVEFTSVIGDPRFEELLTEDPFAFHSWYYVATNLMERGKITEALDVAERSLVHANRSRVLGKDVREAMLARQTPKEKGPISLSPRGQTYYLLARIHAAAAATDRGHVDQVIENLRLAFARSRRFRESWFEKDRHFDGLRAELNDRLGIVDR